MQIYTYTDIYKYIYRYRYIDIDENMQVHVYVCLYLYRCYIYIYIYIYSKNDRHNNQPANGDSVRPHALLQLALERHRPLELTFARGVNMGA